MYNIQYMSTIHYECKVHIVWDWSHFSEPEIRTFDRAQKAETDWQTKKSFESDGRFMEIDDTSQFVMAPTNLVHIAIGAGTYS